MLINVHVFSDTLDSLDEQVKAFFKKCAQPNVKPEWKDEQFKKIQDVSALNVNYSDLLKF